MITELQELALLDIFNGYKNNCQKYLSWGSNDYCEFNTFMDENNGNIICVITTIDGISDSDQVFVKTQNIIVEVDGREYVLEDLFPKQKVITYLQKLKNFNWHG
jgi:hypothetical protein